MFLLISSNILPSTLPAGARAPAIFERHPVSSETRSARFSHLKVYPPACGHGTGRSLGMPTVLDIAFWGQVAVKPEGQLGRSALVYNLGLSLDVYGCLCVSQKVSKLIEHADGGTSSSNHPARSFHVPLHNSIT